MARALVVCVIVLSSCGKREPPAPIRADPPAPSASASVDAAPKDPAPSPAVVRLALGRTHSCALRADGAVWCWGWSDGTLLGDGSADGSDTPKKVQRLPKKAVSIAAGASGSCAILEGDELWCWGDEEEPFPLGPVRAPTHEPFAMALRGVAEVRLSNNYGTACARLRDRSVWCWGGNNLGQLGDGSTKNRRAPVAVKGLRAEEIAVSPEHVCARMADGAVHCWGHDSSGQAGSGRPLTNGPSDIVTRDRPGPVAGLTDAVEVVVGAYHSCARRADGSVCCWGGVNDSSKARDEKIRGAKALAAGRWYVCALLDDGRVRCRGNVGDDASATDWYDLDLRGGKVVEIAGGSHHLCARLQSGHVHCLGSNKEGQLGDGTHRSADDGVRVVFPE